MIKFHNINLIYFLIMDQARGKTSPRGQETMCKKWARNGVCVPSFPLKLEVGEEGIHCSNGQEIGLSGLGEE